MDVEAYTKALRDSYVDLDGLIDDAPTDGVRSEVAGAADRLSGAIERCEALEDLEDEQ